MFDQWRVPNQSVPQLNGFVADLTAYDFVTLRFEILRRVPETLIPDHRLHRPESATPGPGKLGSTLRLYSGTVVNAANRSVSGNLRTRVQSARTSRWRERPRKGQARGAARTLRPKWKVPHDLALRGLHGRKSTGPKTTAGLERSAARAGSMEPTREK